MSRVGQGVCVAISMGDPLGIGPEIVLKALTMDRIRMGRGFVVTGSEAVLASAAARLGIKPFWTMRGQGFGAPRTRPDPGEVVVLDAGFGDGPREGSPGATAWGGRASHAALTAAMGLVSPLAGGNPVADALVTAPISKEAWHAAGIKFPGHTEALADRFKADRCAMLFVGPSLRVILVTIHVALRDVPALITERRVFDAIELGHRACRELGVAAPRIAVCGLNPHAGEHGLFGDEDAKQIAPAVERARRSGIDATGPWPGDAVFLDAAAPPAGKGKYDLVVAMYHDQGLIPAKLLDRSRTVNVTVGLPIIRTSPAHGTAYDIAGKGVADATSMVEAIELASDIALARAKTA